MHPAYFEVRFRAGIPHPAWPRNFAIITAWAPTGTTRPDAENQRADACLARELEVRGVNPIRLTGYSPGTGHAEPGWAAALPFEPACDLGARFEQDAIYWVAGDDLFVTHCDPRRARIAVGGFRERLDP